MDKLIKKAALMMVLCLMGALSAKALELGEIELGKVYNIPNFSDVTATFTAPSTGTLLQDGIPEITLKGVEQKALNYGNFGQIVSYQVTEGVTYQVEGSFTMSGDKVRWEMEGNKALAVTECIPAQGSVLSTTVNYTGEVLVYFNARVKAESAKLVAGSQSVDLTVSESGTTRLVVNVRHALESLFSAGVLDPKGGNEVEIVLSGVGTPDGIAYGNDGVLTLKYVTAPKSLELRHVNFSNGKKLKSYYAAGDPESELEFIFDGAVANDGRTVLSLSCGNPEGENTYYYEELVATVQGERVTFDLSGKLRELNSYLAGSEMPYVAVKLSNVRDEAGNMAAGEGEATVGSYNYFFEYDYIEPVTISSEFIPANGSSLEGVDEIEIWFNNSNMVTFDGIKFACTDVEVVVPKSEIEAVVEDNDITIHVKVPAQIKGKKGVTVTLNNLVSLDGYDHSRQIKAVYDAWVVTLVSPIQEGGKYAATGEDDFVFTVNKPYGYMCYDLYNGDEWVYGTQLNEAGDGTYTSYNNNWPLFTNVDNYMLVRAWNEEADRWNGAEPLESVRMDFIGLTPGFTYSDVKFLSIDPEPNSVITPGEDFCFTVTFDGLVEVSKLSCINTGFGSSAEFAKIEAVDPEETTGLSSVWKLYPNAYNLTGTSIDISIYAYDIDGKLVEGNMGGNEYDYLQFSFSLYNESNYRELTVNPADGDTVEELFCIQVSYDGLAVGPNYSYEGTEMPRIVDKVRETVYSFSADDIEVYAPITGYDEDDNPIYDEVSTVFMYIQTPITENGIYTLIIPENYFTIGSQFETYGSKELNATYTVGKPLAFFTVEPADGETVQSLEYVTINTNAELNQDCEDYITLYSSAIAWNVGEWNYWSTYNGSLKIVKEGDDVIGYQLYPENGTLTQSGMYTLTIPKGMFLLDGVANEEFVAMFTIGGGSAGGGIELTLDPAPGTVKSIEKIEITAPGINGAIASGNKPITITDDNGDVLFSVDSETLNVSSFDWNTWSFLGFFIDLGENPITAEGTYVVDIPAGMFEFIDMSKSVALTAVYTVDGDSGVKYLFVEKADRYEVYTLSGVKVLSTKEASDLSTLRHGIYIINGKKVMVK